MKIKWGNVILAALFITSCLDLGYVFLKLCFSITGLTWFGVVTTLTSLTIASTVGEHLYVQMQ